MLLLLLHCVIVQPVTITSTFIIVTITITYNYNQGLFRTIHEIVNFLLCHLKGNRGIPYKSNKEFA